ncbi:NAD(P)-binding domain-containing protein, partial [Pseudovibrio sp. POLY-S9]|uniref:NAD(P)-binding domain-containing protein n=1 Tax=Pseudovibrio sp. POLY-S9 TaxID=1576596 RepID=UPI001FCBC8FF
MFKILTDGDFREDAMGETVLRVAFIGLGNMGGPMAANLVKAGHEVVGVDLSEEARTAFQAVGG